MTNLSTLITLVGSPPRLSHAETGVGPAIDQASEARSHGSLTLLTLFTSSRSTLKEMPQSGTSTTLSIVNHSDYFQIE